ncbi:hypothetical protein DH2020_018897 [Rehmannia glutinosa]|uniref:DCD domain-containing protein n=1 Tax=Rehmannia glutinosa TaxID=99300 RepID=A0ABR0WPC4_REHGL
MAKDKGKKLKTKGKKVGRPNAKIKKVKVPKVSPKETIVPALPAPLTDPVEATASNNNGTAARGKEKKREKAKHLSGFIFMCNPTTKLECYQYRVFGLPLGKKEVVEEIKPGAKLFLFDFEKKLLYGIYEATSAGKLNLEPAAFRGKFPAQVKFKIFKECLPLSENSLRQIIRENYTGSKFKQELSGKQVKKLLSSFRPLTASSSQPAPHALANVSLSRAMPASAMENQFKHTGRLPVMEVPYLAEMQYSRIPPFVEPQHVRQVNVLQHGYHRAPGYVERVNPTLDHQSLPPKSSYYVVNSQRPSYTEGVAHGVQEPSYSRYRTIEDRPPHDQITSLERRYLAVEETASHDHVTNLERRYLTIDERAPRDQVTIMERQYHQLPLQREALYQDNVAAYNPAAPSLYASSSVTQPQVHAPYHPLPLQRGSQYEDSVVAYNSNPTAPSQYTASAIYRDNVVAYVPSVTPPQAGISQGSAPISSYYSYNAANHLSR